jgi:hypothetical protein
MTLLSWIHAISDLDDAVRVRRSLESTTADRVFTDPL